MAADIESLNFLDDKTIHGINLAAEQGLDDVLKAFIHHRVATRDDVHDFENNDDKEAFDHFLKDTTYMESKMFTQGQKMFDKVFEIVEDYDKIILSHKDLLSNVKFVNLASSLKPSYTYYSSDYKKPGKVVLKSDNPDDIASHMHLEPKLVSVFYLSNILKYLKSKEVENVELFDFSCNNGYTPFMFWKQSDHYSKYGGKRSRNRRYNRKRKITR